MASTDEAATALPAVSAPRAAGWIGAALRHLQPTADQRAAGLGALTAFLVRVASAGLLYLSQIVLARLMGGFEYGIYVFVWTWVLVLGGLSNLGLSTLMIRLVPEYRERGEWDLLRGLLVTGPWMALTASSLVALTAFAALWFFGDVLARPYVLPAFIALACIPMVTLSDIQDGIGRGRGWLTEALLPPYVLRPLFVLIAMLAAYAAGLPMTAVTAAATAVAGTWIASLIQTALVARRLRADVAAGPRTYLSGPWLATSLPLLAITFSEILLQNADVLIISQALGPREVGLYFAAAKTMSLILFIHYAVGSAMANRFAVLNARGDRLALDAAIRQAVRWTFWPSLAAAAVILTLGPFLLSMFGPGFADGYPVMMILVVGFLGRAAAGPSELLLNMLGEQRRAAVAAVAIAMLNIALNLVLVPRFGLVGAAVATATSLVTGAIANTVIARRRLGLSIAIWSHLGRRPTVT